MLRIIALATVVSFIASQGASAQIFGRSGETGEVNPDAQPRFGTYDLALDELTSPYIIGVEAGGPLNARRSGFPQGCFGIMTAEPSVILRIDSPSQTLNVFTAGEGDTTMAVQAPDGTFRCDDDGAGRGMNAGLRLANAQSGNYKVWVGSFDNRNFFTRLIVSQAAPFSQPIGEPNATPTVDAVIIASGPDADPGHIRIDSMTGYGVFLGGMSLYGDNDEECPGHIGLNPSAVIDWSGGGQLSIRANGEADLVMVVMDPAGEAHCSDDSGDVDDRPLAHFTNAAPGRYDVHVGTYMQFDRALRTEIEIANTPLQPSDDPW